MADRSIILAQYQERFDPSLTGICDRLKSFFEGLLQEQEVDHVDRVMARAKDPGRFADKAVALDDVGKPKYMNPFEQIQDQVGVRVVVFYLSDVEVVEERIVSKFFTHLEKKSLEPKDHSAFSYFGRHFILRIPKEHYSVEDNMDELPYCFELQVKTLFQHAWAEAAHDLAYKPLGRELSDDENRYLAFASAQAWGADRIFNALDQGKGVEDFINGNIDRLH